MAFERCRPEREDEFGVRSGGQHADYRRLFTAAGPSFFIVALLGRLPVAMSQLATLLLVAADFDSSAPAGLVTGMSAVGRAFGGPILDSACSPGA